MDVVIADYQELFRIGVESVLANADDIRIIGQANSPEQLVSTLSKVNPQVLLLPTTFLSAVSKTIPKLEQSETALLLLTEHQYGTAHIRRLRVRGVIHRSIDGPTLVDAMHRVARGELFVQSRSSDNQRSSCSISLVSLLNPVGGAQLSWPAPKMRNPVPPCLKR